MKNITRRFNKYNLICFLNETFFFIAIVLVHGQKGESCELYIKQNTISVIIV